MLYSFNHFYPMNKSIPREICRNVDQALLHEWLVSNGSGSYAAGTITGALTRREHGLLVVPDGSGSRTILVAKLDEEVQVEDQQYKLGTNVYANRTINPDGFLYLEQVTFDGTIPTFWYETRSFQLSKTIWMEPGHKTTYVRYGLTEQSAPVQLTLLPFVDSRSFRDVTHGGDSLAFRVAPEPLGLEITPANAGLGLRILTNPPAVYTPLDLWYWRFELQAGENALTDLYMPGLLRTDLAPGGSLTLILTAEAQAPAELDLWQSMEMARTAAEHVALPPSDQFTTALFDDPTL